MKKIRFVVIAILVALFLIPPVYALDSSLKVYDDADLLTDNEEDRLRNLINSYIEKYNMDMVLVTTLNSRSAGGTQDYAQDFYDYNRFGIGEHYDGVLFLIDRTYGYNDVWMVTTGEAIRVYDDERIDWIIDEVAYVKEQGYYKMFEAFIEKSDYYADLGVAPSNEHTFINKNGDLEYIRQFPWGINILISLIVSSIIIAILVFKNKMVKKAVQAMEYLDKQSIRYTRNEDNFINTYTSRTYIPRTDNGGFSGGGHVGGSSTSSGSSGRSHGGGGRRL